MQRAREMLGLETVKSIAETSGFEETYLVTQNLGAEVLARIQDVVVAELAKKTFEEHAVTPANIDVILVATTAPLTPDVRERVRRNLRCEDTIPVIVYSKACDSSGSLLYDLHSGAFFENGKLSKKDTIEYALVAMEGGYPTGLPKDAESPQVFSTGASILLGTYSTADDNTYHPGLHLLEGRSKAVEKGVNCLRFQHSWDEWEEAHTPDSVAPHNSPPDEKDISVVMSALGALRYFPPNIVTLAYAVLLEHAQENNKSVGTLCQEITAVIMHHPSRGIFDIVAGNLSETYQYSPKKPFLYLEGKQRLSIPAEAIEWSITEGNVPAATIHMSMGRRLENMQPGELILMLSYGAGGSFTCALYQLGGQK
ncbi:MAG: hypothetical protein H6774_00250 [Pseudomonadales bacterium]|nr:hypothetical protein [Pseudomonadales bacterium]